MEVNLVAPINTLGYGVVGYNILKALKKTGHDVALFPIGNTEWSGDDSFKGTVDSCMERAKLFSNNAPSIRIWHQFAMDMFPGKGPRIGWPIFELDKFNDTELHHLRSLDVIFVCSEWAKSVIKNNDIDVPTYVIPLGIDAEIFKNDPEERASRPTWTKNSTVFINIGKWEKRKGHEELLEAFCKAFVEEDDVELWMINDNPFIGQENMAWRNKYVNSPMGRHIKFFSRLEKHQHLAKIFNHVDCGVFPSHAEGWNLEIPELMACGAHIIATNYSGHSEYLTKENALLLEPIDYEPANDGKWFHGQGNWCVFDVDELASHMKNVHDKKQAGTLGINEAGLKTAEKFTWDLTVEKIMAAISKEASVLV